MPTPSSTSYSGSSAMTDLSPKGLRARAKTWLDSGIDASSPREVTSLTAAFTALVAETRREVTNLVAATTQLQSGLVTVMPGRRCVRPDHNGGDGSDGRIYGLMCGGCAFELAQ